MDTIDPEPPAPTPAQRKHWEDLAAQVNLRMQDFTKPFVTPISRVILDADGEHGELEGTGNYVEMLAGKYLLTNEHVARKMAQGSLAHQFYSCDTIFRLTKPFQTFHLPFDVGVSALDPTVWHYKPRESAPIPESKWTLAHGGVDGELFFFKGYAAEGSSFYFGHLISNATSYTCQEVPLPKDDRFHSRFHFAIDYRPDLAKPLGDNNPGLPDPHGFSGSLVWNTRFVELGCDIDAWSPDNAVVTGLVWGWPSSAACLVATRAEFVRSVILRVLHP
jgi:hypothetical protein